MANAVHYSPEMNEGNTPEDMDNSQNEFNDESQPQRRSSTFESTFVLYRFTTVVAEKHDSVYFWKYAP